MLQLKKALIVISLVLVIIQSIVYLSKDKKTASCLSDKERKGYKAMNIIALVAAVGALAAWGYYASKKGKGQ